MPKFSSLLLVLFMGSLGLNQNSWAETHRGPSAHTHGEGQLSVVYESGQLLMELETPAANLLGFERAPKNEIEWEQVKHLRESLNKPDHIFTLVPECELVNVDVDIPFAHRVVMEKNTDNHGQARHSSHSVHSHAQYTNNSEHHHRVHKQPTETLQVTHENVRLGYEWRCTGSRPPKIDAVMFRVYPNFEKLKVQWVVNSQQGGAMLNKDRTTLAIKF